MRYFLVLAYEGTNYHGWQKQPNASTIQETIEDCLSVLLSDKIMLTGAGRTDAGVHAKQMVAHFDYNKLIDKQLILRMNSFLPRDIAIYDIFRVNPQAHARFDAISRRYEYYISLRKNPFYRNSSWQFFNIKLDFEKMKKAAKILLEVTDFTSFAKLHTEVKTNNCRIMQVQWRCIAKDLWCFEITADRFLRNMVRAIVGTLIELGKGEKSIGDFKQIIEKKDRKLAGVSAPACGLFLKEINYPTHLFNG